MPHVTFRRLAWMGFWLSFGLILCMPAHADSGWQRYKTRFVTHDGRVQDTGNGNVSHSEGQGWGMLLAEANGDRATFDQLWAWTRRNLGRSDAALFSWRYDPHASPHVTDRNNASDGDILIAWALHRAAAHWGEPNYENASQRIRQAIRTHLVRDRAGYTVLLPAMQGFTGQNYVDLNLSYWVIPAFQAFAVAEPDASWQKLLDSGQRLLAEGRFGKRQLPPDWLRLADDGQLSPAPSWPARFGFEAVRIPMYFLWGGIGSSTGLASISAFWNDTDRQPPAAWVNVCNGEQAEYAASSGVLAIRALLNGDIGQAANAPGPQDDYYAASLLLLSHLVAGDSL